MVKKSLLLIFLPLLLFFFFQCAGKQKAQVVEEEKVHDIRFIPINKNKLYLGTIFNYTTLSTLDVDIEEQIKTYYRTSGRLMVFEGNIQNADTFLDLSIEKYFTNYVESPLKEARVQVEFFLEIKVSLSDIITKNFYVEEKGITISVLENMEAFDIQGSINKAHKKLFNKVLAQLDWLTLTGQTKVLSQFGYSDLESDGKTDKFTETWDINSSEVKIGGTSGDPYNEGNDSTSLSKSNRIELIKQRDKQRH